MTIRGKLKVANVWRNVTKIFFKAGGVYQRVRRVYEKQNNAWVRVWTGNRWKIWSMGLDVTIYPYSMAGHWVNNVHVGAGARSYTLITFQDDGRQKAVASYDIHAQFFGDTPNQIERMYDDLQALPNGQLFCLYSWDIPGTARDGRIQNGTMVRDLLSAVYRVGATPANYSTSQLHGAYILLGKVGQASTFEMTYGGHDAEPLNHLAASAASASIQLSFNIMNNNYTEIVSKAG